MEELLSPLPNLQPDIFLHILLKLPIKSVHQCKLVCKEWSLLISSPFFKSNYNPSSLPNHPLTLTMIPKNSYSPERTKISSLTYQIDRSNKSLLSHPQLLPISFTCQEPIFVLGSWNGLIALYRSPGDFCLFNPYLNKEITVHTGIEEEGDNYWSYCTLYGLSHDPVNDEYKAVFYSRWFDPRNFHAVSFKDGSWKLKTQPELRKLEPWRDIVGNIATIVKGVPYWNCRGPLSESNGSIFYFDSKTEEFQLAPEVAVGKEIFGLGSLDGQLTASVKSDGGLEVWRLQEVENGDGWWSMVFVVGYKLRYLSTLWWMVKEVEVLIDVNGEELMVYNVNDKSLRQLKKKMKRSLYNIVVYMPTLISPMCD